MNIEAIFGEIVYLAHIGDLKGLRDALSRHLKDAGGERGGLKRGDLKISRSSGKIQLTEYKACGNGNTALLATGEESIINFLENYLKTFP